MGRLGKVLMSIALLLSTVPSAMSASAVAAGVASAYVNAVGNGDFEASDLAPWKKTWGTGTAGMTTEPGNVVSGKQAVIFDGQGSLEQIVTGLKPATAYTMTAYGKVGTSKELAIGVKEYNGTESAAKVISSPDYERVELTFTTGEANTTAKVYVFNRGAQGSVYADDFQLMVEASSPQDPQPQIPDQVTDNGIYPFSDPDNSGKWTYSLDFSDEYDSQQLNLEKWHDHHIFWNGRAPSFFSASNVRVENGKLILTTKYENIPEMEEANNKLLEGETRYENYTTAAVMSKRKSHYGYFEIKAKAAKASITSSFWLKASDGDKSEIDLFEIVGASKLKPYFSQLFPTNLHSYPDGPGGRDVSFPYEYHTEEDLTEDFHVYGLEWNEKWIKFYYDGKLVRAQKNLHWKTPEYIIMDMETFAWHDYPDPASLPADYEIDYVRVWRTNEPASDDSGFELPEPKLASALKGTPVIDGQVDALWSKAASLGPLRTKGGAPLHAATVRTMWDESYLYVLAEVQDQELAGTNPQDTYQNDSVEIYIDEGREGASPYDSNDRKINVDYMSRMSGVNVPDGLIRKVEAVEGGYRVELAIPWQSAAPQIGFDVQVNDATAQAGVRVGYLGWNDPLDLVWKDMSMAGILELGPGVSPEIAASLKGADAVQIGEPYVLTYGLAGIDSADPVYAQEVSVRYDTSVFEFKGAEPLAKELRLIGDLEHNEQEGRIRIVLASLGANGAVHAATDVLALQFKSTAASHTASGWFEASAVVSNGTGEEKTVQTVRKQVTFGHSYIDLNGDGKAGIGDLGIVSKHYGKTKRDPGWTQIQAGDRNGNGKIDLPDLKAVRKQLPE